MDPITDPKKNTQVFSEKLSRYAVLTAGGVAGTMALFESGEAANVVTDTLITLVDATSTVQTQLDLNGDGTADVEITVGSASLLVAGGLNGGQLAGTLGPGSFFYPTAFAASQLVNNNAAPRFSAGSTSTLNTFGTLANGSTFGNWAGAVPTSGYLGARFDISGATHFGWVHVTWDPTADTATIDRYAYNDSPGVASHVPEPSALTLLALGAAGLAARRRRKEKK